jgi:hypothetical protein
MTNADDSSFELIAAFVDGEAVPPHALKDALANAGARDYLIDLLVLRRAVADMGPTTFTRHTRPTLRRVLVAAAVVIASVGGYAVGARTVLAAKPGGSVAVLNIQSPQPPRPTETIILQPGVNWHSGGGN